MKKLRTKLSAPGFQVQKSQISSQYDYDREHTMEKFTDNPVTAKIGGGAATGTAGDENVLLTAENAFEYHILGTQTILAPSKSANGLNIAMDQAANDGVELSQGILARSKHAFVIGTSAPFFFRVKFKIGDVSGTDDCAIGFRKAEAYQAAIDNYAEMAALNVISGDIKIETILTTQRQQPPTRPTIGLMARSMSLR
jgi:hypothetical protein